MTKASTMAWLRLLQQVKVADQARTGELMAEFQLCRSLLNLAHNQGWPKVMVATSGGWQTIRPTRLAWHSFAMTQSPALLVQAIVALYPTLLTEA